MRAKASSSTYETLFVLDLDRCLITETVYDLFNITITKHIKSIDIDSQNEARARVEATGGSFDLSSWLLKQEGFGEADYRHLLDDFIAQAHDLGQDYFLAPGAKELLVALKQNTVPHLIMTYGGQHHQLAKLRATQLDDILHMIVNNKHKAHFIRDWWDDTTGVYSVAIKDEIVTARTVVLVDDKASAFDDLPGSSARGYWLKAEHLLASQQGSIPANVRPISSLTEILTFEQLTR